MNLKQNEKVLLCGSRYFIDKYLEKVLEKDDLEVHSFFADEIQTEYFNDLIFTRSLFYSSKAIIINRAENLKKTDIFDSINRALADISFYIVFADEKRASTALKHLKDFCFVSEGKKTSGGNIAEIIKIFENKGLSIDKDVASGVWALVPDLSEIESYAEKISLYFYGTSNLPKEILDFISEEPQGNIFNFLENFISKRKQECLHSYINIGDIKNTSSQLFNMLINYMAGLYFNLRSPGLIGGRNPFFKGNSYFMRSVNSNSHRWTVEQVSSVISLMSELDVMVKTGRISPPDALLCMVMSV